MTKETLYYQVERRMLAQREERALQLATLRETPKITKLTKAKLSDYVADMRGREIDAVMDRYWESWTFQEEK